MVRCRWVSALTYPDRTLSSCKAPIGTTKFVEERENGDVFLEGSVAQRDDRREIENIAEGVSGVVDVINRLRVRRG